MLAIAVFVTFILFGIRAERMIFVLWGTIVPIAIVMGLIFVSPAITQRFYLNYQDRFPEYTAQARVISKTTDISGGGTSYIGDGVIASHDIVTEHYVSFSFNHRRENFLVDVSLYNVLKTNDTGVLTYKEIDGDFLLIDFEPDN